MKKILGFVSAFAAIMAVSSCNKTALGEQNATQKYTFTCVIDDETSKLGIDAAGKTAWEEGDQILIHGEYTKDQAVVTLEKSDISADGKVATITFEGVTPYVRAGYESTFYAGYPADAVKNDDHCYYYQKFNNSNKVLMAGWNVGEVFTFKNLSGVISFSVDDDYDEFEFSGNANENVGYETYQVKLVPQEQNYKHTLGKALKAVKAEFRPGINYFGLPNGADLTAGFSIKFYRDNECVKIAKSVAPVNVARGSYLPLGDITSRLKDYTEPGPEPEPEPVKPEGNVGTEIFARSGATDLSAAGAANCYVVYGSGNYVFKALKGNSEEILDYTVGALLLWETYNNGETVAENSVVEQVGYYKAAAEDCGYIYFKMPATFKAGNAVIAVKNSLGDIIWSWHIWAPASQIQTSMYGNIFSTELMDRNLGALVPAVGGEEPEAVESYGMLYQWGRKDPFVGAAANNEEGKAKVAGVEATQAGMTISLAESIKNPTVLGHSNSADWLDEPDNTLWKNDVKTVYDPCPAGYKVPARDKSQVLFAGGYPDAAGWAVSASNYWIKIGEPAAVFPVCGYRDDYAPKSVAKVGKRAAYWTSYASSNPTGYHLNWRVDSGSYALGETGKSRGCSVRCVAIAAPEE